MNTSILSKVTCLRSLKNNRNFKNIMKRIILLISLAAITLTACKSHYKPVLTSGQGINFKVTSLDSALNEVKAAKKPLFVFAHASWCPTCREMEQTVLIRKEL